MRNHPVSINDIARALGVSASTVSRALRDHPDINAETRQRVHAYAREVNYRPNALAVGLKHHRTFTLGIIVPEIVHHFFSSIISGIENIAYGKGYRVMMCQSNEDHEREQLNLQALIDHRVDGLLVSPSKTTADDRHFRWALNAQVPLVFFDRFLESVPSDRVVTDDLQGARIVTTHMIRRGCRRILHLAATQQLMVGRERCQGYLQALEDHGIEASDELILLCDTPYKVEAARDRILQLAPGIDGIFCVNDFSAVAVIKLLQEAGYQIPGQIAVTGFGDDPIASIVQPRLTTIEQKGYEMGQEAARLLLARIENQETEADYQTKIFPVTLKVRDSA